MFIIQRRRRGVELRLQARLRSVILDQMGENDRSDPTLLARKWQLVRRIAAPDFLVGAQRVVFHEDHLVGVQIIELDGPDDISVQILDAHVDAVEAKQWADEPRLDCSFEDRSGRRKLGLALPPQPR
jgi:hypothetical protein